MTKTWDPIKFGTILENVHTWAMRELRPRISMYIDLWRDQCSEECSISSPKRAASDEPDNMNFVRANTINFANLHSEFSKNHLVSMLQKMLEEERQGRQRLMAELHRCQQTLEQLLATNIKDLGLRSNSPAASTGETEAEQADDSASDDDPLASYYMAQKSPSHHRRNSPSPKPSQFPQTPTRQSTLSIRNKARASTPPIPSPDAVPPISTSEDGVEQQSSPLLGKKRSTPSRSPCEPETPVSGRHGGQNTGAGDATWNHGLVTPGPTPSQPRSGNIQSGSTCPIDDEERGVGMGIRNKKGERRGKGDTTSPKLPFSEDGYFPVPSKNGRKDGRRGGAVEASDDQGGDGYQNGNKKNGRKTKYEQVEEKDEV